MKAKDPDIDDARRSGKTRLDRGESSWYACLVGPPFKAIGFFYRTYNSNRGRLARFASKPRVSSALKKLIVFSLLLWIVVWLFASDESRNRLGDVVKQQLGSFESRTGQ